MVPIAESERRPLILPFAAPSPAAEGIEEHQEFAGTPSAPSTLNPGVGARREFRDTLIHTEVSHEQEVYRPTVKW